MVETPEQIAAIQESIEDLAAKNNYENVYYLWGEENRTLIAMAYKKNCNTAEEIGCSIQLPSQSTNQWGHLYCDIVAYFTTHKIINGL